MNNPSAIYLSSRTDWDCPNSATLSYNAGDLSLIRPFCMHLIRMSRSHALQRPANGTELGGVLCDDLACGDALLPDTGLHATGAGLLIIGKPCNVSVGQHPSRKQEALHTPEALRDGGEVRSRQDASTREEKNAYAVAKARPARRRTIVHDALRRRNPVVAKEGGEIVVDIGDKVNSLRDTGPVIGAEGGEEALRAVDLDDVNGGVGQALGAPLVLGDLARIELDVRLTQAQEASDGDECDE